MKLNNTLSPLKNFKDDIPASIVVFLVAMPLCLGIALASGAPLFSGLISGIIGGIIVGALSGSPLGVSGPAAGLAVVVLNAISDLGSFEIFLVAVVLAGIIQLILGFAKAGIIAYFFPSSVIHGMLSGIGILIFIKQIPHAFGYDKDPEGDFEFAQVDGENTFTEISNMMNYISPGVILITSLSLGVLLLWETKFFKNLKFTKLVQGPLVAVVLGIVLTKVFQGLPNISISSDHLVSIPVPESAEAFLSNFSFPDFSALANSKIYITAIVIAVIASLETLLCVEASDKLDPLKRVTPTNKELKAQGIGNILSGFVGGLPITQVIVRSSANAQSGGKTKASTIFHGFFLLVSVIFIPTVLNWIPLGTLAAILLVVGYKLAKPSLIKKMYNKGKEHFIAYMVTILGIIFTDLLIGIALGMSVAVFIILRNNFKVPYQFTRDSLQGKEKINISLSEDVTFLNKASIQKVLTEIPDNVILTIDGSKSHFIDKDVLEIIEDFKINALSRDIHLVTIDLDKNKQAVQPQHFEIKN